MSRGSYVLKNFIYLLLSQFATKVLSFFLIPLYTSCLSATDYGTYDILYSMISLIFPILLLNIWEATTRFTLENKEDVGKVLFVNIKFVIIASLIVFVSLVINNVLSISAVVKEYCAYFYILFVLTIINVTLIALARGLELIPNIAFISFIHSAITIVLNVVLIYLFRLGIKGLFISNIVGILVQDILLCISLDCKRWIRDLNFDNILQRKMLKYSIPFVFNTISWWVVGVSDRFVITALCSLKDNGIYAISAKIPNLLNSVASVFADAWSISAIKEFNKEKYEEFYSKMYNSLQYIMISLCSLIIVFSKLIAKLMFKNEYYFGWVHLPFLTFSVVFIALSGCIGSMFHAIKYTDVFATTSIVGAIVNVILNIFLITLIGSIGASISTLVSYFVIWILRLIKVKNVINLYIDIKLHVASLILILFQTIVLFCVDFKYALILNLFIFVLFFIININVFLAMCMFASNNLKMYFGRILK